METQTSEDRLLLVASMAPVAGSLGVFALCAATTPIGIDRIVLVAVVLAVAATGVAGGRPAAFVAAVMGALSFDFFHVEPLRVLHARSLVEAAVGLLVVAAISGRQTLASRV